MAQANIVAKVVFVSGEAYARDKAGHMHRLQAGDVLREGDTVISRAGAEVQLAYEDGRDMVLRGNETIQLDAEVAAADKPDASDSALIDAGGSADRIIQALNEGGNLDAVLEAPAAGQGGGVGDESHSFVRLLRIVESIDPLGFNFGSGDRGLQNPFGSSGDQPPVIIAVTGSGIVATPAPTVAIADLNGSAAGHASVVEGSAPSAAHFVVSAPAGLAAVDVGGATLSLAQLSALGSTPVSIATSQGTLVLTGYNPATGEVSYTYAAPAKTAAADVLDSIPVTVTDTAGATATGTLGILIADTAPAAHPDTASVSEDGPLAATGNVITSGPGTDTLGADAATVTAVAGSAAGTVGGATAGAHGSLTLNADGSYTYALNNADPAVQALAAGQTLTDSFTYTLTDADGDTSSTTLTVTVNGTNDAPVAVADSNTTPEDTPVSGNVLANDGDVDAGTTLIVTQFVVGGTTYAVGATAVLAEGALTIAGDGSYTFIPVPDYNGPVPVAIYTVSDGTATTTSTLTIAVTPVNDAPLAVPDANSGPEDSPLSGNVLANDSDVDGDTLSVTQFTVAGVPGAFAAGSPAIIPGVGSLVINGDGSYTFTPLANYNGPVPVATYTVSDGTATASSTLTLNVTAVNDAPVAVDDVASTPVNTPLDIAVKGNDSDPDNTPAQLTVSSPVLANPLLGTVSVNPDGSLHFVPAANVSGPVTITYTLTDPDGLSATATVTVNVGANTLPDSANAAATIAEDTSYTLQGSDFAFTDPDAGQTLAAVRIDSLPGAGSLTLNGAAVGVGQVIALAEITAGHLVFTPAVDGNGSPYGSFTFSVQDSAGAFDAAPNTFTLNVTPVNDAPLANPDSYTVNEDTSLVFDPRGNDSDVDGPALTVTQVAGHPIALGTPVVLPEGTVSLNPDGTLSFVPNLNFNGPVNFAYTVSDGTASVSSTVSIAVTPVDDATIAQPDTRTIPEDTVATGNVLGNDSDVDNTLAVTTFTVGGTTYAAGATASLAAGTLTIGSNGAYTFTPAANWHGDVPQASYSLNTGSASTLDITVTPVNDAPVANDDLASTPINTPASGNLLANDTDVDSDPLTVTGFTVGGTTYTAGQTATLAGVGTLAIAADGAYTFTPELNYAGPVPVATYTLTDGAGGSATATLTVNLGTNTPPTGQDATYTLAEDGSRSFAPADFGFADADAGQTLAAVRIDSLPTAGTLTLSGVAVTAGELIPAGQLGNLVYTPAANANANANGAPYGSFIFSVQDSGGAFDTVPNTLSFNVTPVNDAPVAAPDSNTTLEDTPVSGNVLTNDSDVDTGTTLTVTQFVVGGTTYAAGATAVLAEGALTIAGDGSYTFTPALNYNGPMPVATYTVSDGITTATSTLSITVTPVNDAPVATPDANATLEDTPASGNVLANDSDVDGDTLSVTQFTVAGVPGTFAAGSPATIPGIGSLVINGDGSYTFTPLANYNGPVPVATYTVSDGTATASSTLTLNVTAVNDAPVAVADTATAVEAGGVANGTAGTDPAGNVLTNDTDVDAGDSKTVSAITGGTVGGATTGNYGSLVLNADGSYTYTVDNNNATVQALPTAGNTLTDSFTYTMRDTAGATSTATLTVTIQGANDAPLAVADTAAVNEDATVTRTALTGVLANDTDVDAGDSKTVSAIAGGTVGGITAGAYGHLTLNSDGSYSYVVDQPAAQALAAGATATESFTYTVRDTAGATSSATLTITITGTNDAPVANADTGAVAEDAVLAVSAANGVIQGSTGGSVADSDVDNATNTLVVSGAVAGTGAVTQGAGVGSSLTGTYGHLTLNADGSYNYVADKANALAVGATAVDTFTYTVKDPGGLVSNTTTLKITVTGTNDAPIAVADTNTVSEDAASVSGDVTPGTVGQDSDPDAGDILTVVGVAAGILASASGNVGAVVAGTYGSVTIAANGSYTYVPGAAAQALAAGQNGTDTFTYTISDGHGGSATTTLTLTVQGANDAPAISGPLTGTVTEDGTTTSTGTLTVVDPDAGQSSFVVQSATAGTYGSFSLDAAGHWTYNLNNGAANVQSLAQGQAVTDSFVVTTADGTTRTVVVTVNGTNDAPIAVADTAAVNEDATVTRTAATGVLANDTDVDGGDSKTVSAITGGTVGNATAGSYGHLTLNADGTYSYVADNANALAAGATATDTFTYTVRDTAGAISTATLTVTVTGTNDGPVAVADSNSGAEDTPITGNVLANDSDVDSASLTVTQFTVAGLPGTFAADSPAAIAGVGTLVIHGDGSYTFTPAANYNGPVPVATYTVSDGTATATSTLTLAVTPVNDAPVALPDAKGGAEDTPISGNVLANDTDVDGDTLAVTQFTVAGLPGTFVAGSPAAIAGVGTLVIQGDGSYTFTPAANYNGPVPVATYTVSDGTATASSTLSLNVTPVNDAPVAAPDAATTPINTAANGNVLINDTDVDGNPLTVTGFTVDTNNDGTPEAFAAGQTATIVGVGTLTIGSGGAYTFTPAANYAGPVPVATYTVTDGQGGSASATLAVTIGANTPPTGQDATYTLPEDGSRSFAAADFGFADVDAGQTFAAVRIDSLPTAGTLTLSGVPVTAGELIPVGQLGNLVFTPAANANGAPYGSFSFSVQDNGGAFDTAPNTLSFNVTPVNDAPVNTVPLGQNTAEDGALVFSAATGNPITVADVDGDVLTTTLTLANGTLTLGSTAGVTVSGNGSGLVTLQGLASAINAAIDGSIFLPRPDYNGPASVTVSTTDGVLTDTDVIPVTVTPVADIANDSATTSEDTPVNVAVNANDSFENAGHTVTAIDGSAIVVGGSVAVANGSVTLKADGSLDFTPTANFNGSTSFNYTVTSGGVTETANVDVTVNPVNDAPVNAIPGAQGTSEDVARVFSVGNGNAITVADVDGGVLTTTLSVGNGTLTALAFAGATISNNGTGTVTISGSAAAINGALNGLAYTPTADYNGPATLTVTTTDGIATDIDTVAITVTPVADIAADAAITNEDTTVTIAVNANDSFENTGYAITAVNGSAIAEGGSVAVTNGTVTLSGGQLVFTPAANFNGAVPTFTYTVTSGGVTETANVNVTVNAINDAPVNAVPAAQNTPEDTGLVFSSGNGNAITVADVDSGSLTTTVAVTNGILTLGSTAGVTVTGNGSGSVQISGTAAAINAALNGTTYTNTADYNGPATLTVTTTDGSASDIDTVAITVAPVADIAADTAVTSEDTAVTIAVLANDSFENPARAISAVDGLAIVAGGPAVAVANGTVSLNGSGQLVFSPNANYNGATSFSYSVSSGGVTETATVNVTVNPVNDAPVNTVPAAQNVNEDTALVFSSGNGNAITVADVDSPSLTTTLSVTHGVLTLGSTAGVTVTGNGTGSVQLVGTAAAINAALNGTAFTNTADYNGPANLTVTTTDGVATDVATVAIAVAPVVDITADTAVTNEDTPVTINVLANDSFEGAGRTISAVNGLAIVEGGNVAVTNGMVTLSGGQLVFTPAANFNGAVPTFTYTVTSGGVTETANVNVTVNAVNDPPVNTVPGAQSTPEDTALVFSSATGNALTVTDVDGGSLTATVAVTNGILTLGSTVGVTVTGNGSGSVQISGTAAAINAALNGTQFANTADYNGPATLTVTTTDGVATDIDTVAITVTPVADIAADAVSTNEDTPVNIAVNANDSFENAGHTIAAINGTAVAVGGTVAVANGSVTLRADGTLDFVPAANTNGPTSFTYTVASGGVSETATVNVTVNAVNDAPVANADTGAVAEDATLAASAINGVIQGSTGGSVADSDVDNATNTLVVSGAVAGTGAVTQGAGVGSSLTGTYGHLTLNADGSYNYVADKANALAVGATAVDTFTYTVKDPGGLVSNTTTLKITVTGTNDAPLAVADTNTVSEDAASVSGDVTPGTVGQDSDPDAGDILTVVGVAAGILASASGNVGAVVAGTYGSVTIAANGSYTYVPGAAAQALAAGQNGTDTFTYTISDGHGGSATTTLTLTVQGANDAPAISGPLTGTVTEDGTTTSTGTLTVVDPDAGQSSFVVQSATAGTYGSFSLDAAGHWTYNLNNGAANVQSLAQGQAVTDSFVVTTADGTTRTVVVTVNGTNDAPIAVADSNAITEGTTAAPGTVGGDVTPGTAGQDRDIDNGSTFTVTGVAAGTPASAAGNVGAVVSGTYGTVTIAADGTYTYTLDNTRAATNGLAAGQATSDVFTYTVTDNNGATATTTLTIAITGTNDAPVVAGGASASVSENLLANGIAHPTDPFPQTLVSSGNLAISDVDGSTFTIGLSAPAGALTSGGQAIVWTGGSPGTDLVGSAGGSEVLRVHMTSTGAYTVTLSGPVDHATAGADVATLNFGVAVSDGIATTNASLAVNIEDSIPLLNSPHQAVTLPVQNTNLMIVLDISGSMGQLEATVNGVLMTGLAAAQQAINTLLDSYAAMGSVAVRLVTFSSGAAAHGSAWETVASAKTYLASLSASGGTNYDAALATAETAFAATGKIAGAQNVSYFMTDGLPTYGAGTTSTLSGSTNGTGSTQAGNDTGIQASEESNWTSFLATNSINSFAIGMGGPYTSTASFDGLTHTSQYYIDPIAYNGVTNTNTTGLVVTDWGQLASQLQATVGVPPAIGGFMTGAIVASGSGVGSDGGYMHYVSVDGVTYTYDQTTHALSTSNGSTPTWDATAHQLTILTSHGGTFAVNMDSGAYTYNAPVTTTAPFTESIGAQLIDRDGDAATGTLTLDVARAQGGSGSDAITGTTGSDILIGGAGNDTLTGLAGADTFRWVLGDAGTAAAPATDSVTDFNTALPAGGGDILDLRDLLVGEAHTGTNAGNLASYLHFSYNGGTNTTTVSVNSHGAGVDQVINLQGVNLVGAFTTDQQVIQDLLTKGKLVTD